MDDIPRWRADPRGPRPAPPPPLGSRAVAPEREVWTVSRLNREAKLLLETGLPALWIEGELSNFARPSSGHWYFSLKDAGAQVRCAMFRNANARVRVGPRDGLHVLVRARVSLYEARGDYQLIVEHLEEAGEGALRRRFEELKARLAAEGLFDAERKRALPRLPRRIGLVTSPTGAAIRDVLHVLRRRFPAVPVLVYPTAVQGATAAAEIAAAIRRASAGGLVDVLIVARGGGSLEDLWSFNDEDVARAIHDCAVPVVTGVGHEVDFTIADFVADVRAPTPSGAAELVVPDRAEWSRAFAALQQRLAGALGRARTTRAARLAWAARRLAQLHPGTRLAERAQRVDELESRLRRALRRQAADAASRLARLEAELRGLSPAARVAALEARRAALAARLRVTLRARLEAAKSRSGLASRALNAVSPLATLDRGYSIVEREGRVVTAATAVAPGDTIRARTARGAIVATVRAVEP